tara:strand:- start:101 stop:298 length:198 start_codon:yes stop_codon:yes gene_type:complete
MDSLKPKKLNDPNKMNFFFKRIFKKEKESNKYLDKKIFMTKKKDIKFKKNLKKKGSRIKENTNAI